MNINILKIENIPSKPKLRLVGRLKHNNYMQEGNLVSKSTFTVLKKKSQLTLQDLICDSEYDIYALNLSNYAEGIYEIVTCNHSRDFETGIVDDWELKLIPYVE